MYKIYTDGSCLKNPNGPGGWAFCLIDDEKEWHVSGGESNTTNNRMEMVAVIEAVQFMDINKEYTIYTDSKLVMNCAQGLWKRNKNLDLWEKYNKFSKNKNIKWIWVKGHNGNPYNDLVDKLAKDRALEMK